MTALKSQKWNDCSIAVHCMLCEGCWKLILYISVLITPATVFKNLRVYNSESHRDVAAADMRRTTKAVDVWKDIATVKLLSAESKVTGDVKIKEISKDKIKLEGAITGKCLPEIAVSMEIEFGKEQKKGLGKEKQCSFLGTVL